MENHQSKCVNVSLNRSNLRKQKLSWSLPTFRRWLKKETRTNLLRTHLEMSNLCKILCSYNGKWLYGSVALIWQNAKCKFKFATKHAQANQHSSKKLSPGFTLCFAFHQSKATDPISLIWQIAGKEKKKYLSNLRLQNQCMNLVVIQ